MIRDEMVTRGGDIADVERACDFAWPEVVLELRKEGLTDEEIHQVLGDRQAWADQARAMKMAGYPYDESVYLLRELSAEWGDVARALMEAGLTPADMLRAALPCTDQPDESWAVVQAAVCDSALDADWDELVSVMTFYLVTPWEVLEGLPPGSPERGKAAERLGLED